MDRLIAAALLVAAILGGAVTPAFAANRTIELYFTHTRETLKIVYKRNGQYVPSALRDINRFLRDWRRNEATKMDPELLDLVWDVQQHFGGRTIHVVSAYRSPATNSMLRGRSRGVAKNSQHMLGKAMDFYIKGVKISDVRAYGMSRQVGGVGYYPRSNSPFVHLDTGSVRAWPRMSRGELSRVFPDGKTLHLPSDGKPLSGYAEAQQLEKSGKLAKLDRSGGGGGGSLFGFGGGGGGGGGSRSSGGTNVASLNTGVIRPGSVSAQAPTTRSRAASRAEEKKVDEPVRVQTASLGTAASSSSSNDDSSQSGGLFRQLPNVSLGGLIGRFRDDDEAEDEADAEVRSVAPPSAPLTAVASQAPATPAAPEEAPAPVATGPAPIPRIAPRTDTPPSVPATAEGAPDETPSENELPIVVAALPPQRPTLVSATPASDTTTLGYATNSGPDLDTASPLSQTAAMIPRSALSEPVPPASSPQLSRQLAPPPSVTRPMVDAGLSPVRGASPALIADSSGISEGRFATLTAPDQDNAARGGILMAQGFLGTPSGFQDGVTDWPTTDRFTGVRITVFAKPRS
ncbi:DUF882 domain-containing protein [Acuticoccus sp. M5D2P5]|uniref:DUF882 domain-containing protein n=1 Tax=Acuticoccus kalidii TaxID=2910977 RepID=UPI001F47E075|nr:DUF882 domain-containing protein [Acuticoccus kalidii]MCF3932169.1 DUF882 domain-containing protein [Acuticoccus kalidii]